MNEKELKPCPFCGGSAHFADAQHTSAGTNMVMCNKCGCRVYSATAEIWNTRTELEAEKQADELCNWFHDDDGMYESDCGLSWQCIDGSPKENHMEYCPKCGKKLNEVQTVPVDTLQNDEN
jgi:predicted nucleic-acid-binding Zn-ribbon protein